MSEPISIQFTRFSAFYSPLIATIAGGFLAAEGFAPLAACSALDIAACSAGVFSPLRDGSCRNLKSQFGSTRAPSLVSRGGNKSLPSGV